MAWDFDGVDQYVRFTMSAALQAATGGPMTMAALVHLDATTDGAVIHTMAGTANRQFLEIFGTWNFGTTAGTRTGPAGTTGAWYIVIVTKDTGTVAPEYTLIPLATGIPVSGTITGGGATLGDGLSPGATGVIQVARFGASATELVNGRIAATAIWTAYKNQAAREALTTWALWLASGGIQWAVKYDTLSTLTDATLNGGDEIGRFGTAAITLAADPTGFFPGGASDTSAADPAPGSVQAGGSPAAAVADVVAVAAADSGVQAGGSPAVAAAGTTVAAPAASGVQAGGTAAQAVADTLAAAPAGSGVQAGGSAATAAADTVAISTPGSVQAGESPAAASSVTLAADPAPTGVQAGGSAAVAVANGVAAAAPGGVQLGGSPAAAVADVVAVAAAGSGVQAGGSPAAADSGAVPVDVAVAAPNAPGVTLGGSPATGSTDEVVHDLMVMPVLINALGCLQAEVMKVAQPPAHFQVRPGATFSAFADNTSDECCAGIAWVRPGPMFESDDFPEVRGPSRQPAAYWAATVELGIMRCMDTVSDEEPGDKIVTAAQWLAMTQRHMDDAAALRRAICCLRDMYGKDAVIAGQIAPLENEANCGGQTVVLTIRVPACDCVE